MNGSPTQVAAFLRAYPHHKSADWPGNQPHLLADWTAEALDGMPTTLPLFRVRLSAVLRIGESVMRGL
jgi:hypothetical protein